jgi:hypothetical protein
VVRNSPGTKPEPGLPACPESAEGLRLVQPNKYGFQRQKCFSVPRCDTAILLAPWGTPMKRISSVFFIAVLSTALASGQATPTNPAPPPELKKLDFLVGTWKVQGELKSASPSPGGKFSFLNRYAWMSGRYFLVLHSTTTGALGNATGSSYYGYSPQDKTYTYDAFNSLGQASTQKGRWKVTLGFGATQRTFSGR